MEYRLENCSRGWRVLDGGGRIAAGPFTQRTQAVEWIEHRGRETERAARESDAEARKEALSDESLARALKAAIANPPQAPRGRPPTDDSREADIAFAYYWRLRRRKNPEQLAKVLARAFACTPDHVRKVKVEYSPVATYDDDLLRQLSVDALQRRKRGTRPKARAPLNLKAPQEWLCGLLRDGPILAQEVLRRGRMGGFSARTLERAKGSLGIVSTRSGRAWVWSLPPVKAAKLRI